MWKILLILICTLDLYASTADQIKKWFDEQNYSNVTKGGVYKAQSARYATLGGFTKRTSVSQPFSFINIQTPKFSAGCGGIDFYTGGFSAINADQFIKNLRAIGQNAQSLAFMLAIQIVSPQLSGVMEDIQTWAQKYLTLNMDSCEAATKIVGGTMDLFGAKEGNCTVKRMQDFQEDWGTANYHCTTGGKIKSTEHGDANRIDFIKGNLAWYVLMQDQFFKNDPQFAELVLNLTGTILINDSAGGDDAPIQVRVLNPAINGEVISERFDNIYKSLLYGRESIGSLQLYKCQQRVADPNSCQNLSESLQNTSPSWDGLHQRIQKLVKSIIDKIYTDNPLTNEEKGLIATTSIPLYRYLTATAAYFPRGIDVSRMTNEYTRLIAEDILLRALNAVISRVEQQCSSLPNGLSGSSRVKEYQTNVENILRGIANLKKKNNFTAEKFFEMQQRIQLYEKALMSRLSSGIINNAMWGN